jgi:3-methyladenine DNA glycosylase/8-oxoguanine DNA glycosylase
MTSGEGLLRTFPFDGPLDLPHTLGHLRHGPGDPTMRFEPGRVWRATRTPDGPVTLALSVGDGSVRAAAWGPGGRSALEGVPGLLGLDVELPTLEPPHRIVRDLSRRFAGLRVGRTGAVMEALLPAVLEQKVTGLEARRAYIALIRHHGAPAPGPAGLRLPPSAETLARLPYHAFHPFGVERRRAETIRTAAARGGFLEDLVDLPLDAAYARLRSLPGIGAWTAAEVGRAAFGDADAVSVGDYHLPNLVAWALAGEPRGDDARMLELLEPYRGQRGRVVRMLELSGLRAPRYGPRMAPRSIAAI